MYMYACLHVPVHVHVHALSKQGMSEESYLFECKDGSFNVSQVGRLEGVAENLLRFTKVKLLGFQDNCLKGTAL